MNNIKKFELAFEKYSNHRMIENNKREYIIGCIQATMVLMAIFLPLIAIMLSPKYINFSPLMLVLIIVATTVIGIVIWKKFEATPDFTAEKVEQVDNDFNARFCPKILKEELLEKYTMRIQEISKEVLDVENKKIYYLMIERMKYFQEGLMRVRALQGQYDSYYSLHQYVYFYHMFNSISSFKNRDERHFEPCCSYD